jgi:hypothetical protein
MASTWKAIGNCAVAASVAIAFLTSILASARPSLAGAPIAQDVPKAAEKAEVKIEIRVRIQDVVDKFDKIEKQVDVATKKVMNAAPVQKAAQPARPDEDDDEDQAIDRRLIQQFRPILQSELRLLTSVAEPSATQRREIAMLGGKELMNAAAKLAAAQQGVVNVVRGTNGMVDPRVAIREAMEKAAKEKLSPEQFGRYKKELEEKARDQRETVILNIVANLDKAMILSKDQRDKLCTFILAQWDDRTYPTIETLTMYESYFPMIPNQLLSPILNNDQMKIWNSLPKIQIASIRNYTFFNNQPNAAGDDVEDEDVKAALAEEAKKK